MYYLVFRRYAPFSQFGFGFEGDHRSGPSISLVDSARTIGMVPFSSDSVSDMDAFSSGTELTGAGIDVQEFLGKHFSEVEAKVINQEISPGSISFSATTSGANPLAPGAPAIDTAIDFSAQWSGDHVSFEGTLRGDNFPNAEVFVLDRAGYGGLLFDGLTTGGRNTGPMTRLWGKHAQQVLGSFSAIVSTQSGEEFMNSFSCHATTM